MLLQDLEHMEFPGDLAVEGSVIGTAVAWVWSLAGELPHAAGMAKNKKQNETPPPPEIWSTKSPQTRVWGEP